jgi:hypothetical protein
MPWPELPDRADRGPDELAGPNTDLVRLVAAAADLCRKPLRHAVIDADPAVTDALQDRCLRLEVRSPEGERLPEEDLELELYRSGGDLHLTLAWRVGEERPMLWQGSHPVWMDGRSGQRCERPPEGPPLEALARRLRALLVEMD